jgi:hypothetical protein
MLERHVEEGTASFGEGLAVEPQVAVDMDSPPAALSHPCGDPKLTVDQHRTAVADEDARGHRGKAMPRGEKAAGFVERGTDEPAMDDPRGRLVALGEAEPRLVTIDPLLSRPRKVDAVRVLLPATPACRVMVRRDVYRRPPRSKWAL